MSGRGGYRTGRDGRPHLHGANRAIWRGVKQFNRDRRRSATPEPVRSEDAARPDPTPRTTVAPLRATPVTALPRWTDDGIAQAPPGL